MAFKKLITQNYASLLIGLDCSYEFLGALQRNEAIRPTVSSIIERATATASETVTELLSAFLNVSDDLQDSLMGDVMEALKFSGQGHIANMFLKDADKSVKVSMSIGHRLQLQTKMLDLCQYMDPENGLLIQLLSRQVISCSEDDRIRSAPGLNDMTRQLVKILMKKSNDAFETLTMALDEVGQKHVAYILTGEGNIPLNKRLRDRLLMKRDKLIRSIYSKGLVSVLISKGVFTEFDQQRVEYIRTENERIEKMLDLTARKSQSDFSNFLAALEETKHEHVVAELLGAEIAAEVELIIDEAGACEENVKKELRMIMQTLLEKNENTVREVNDYLEISEASFTGVEEGSIIVKFRCKDVAALRELHTSGKLDKLFTKAFCHLLAAEGLVSIRLKISDSQFQQCFETLTALKLMTSEHREALASSAKLLVGEMTVSADLLSRMSLCEHRRQAIEAAPTRGRQVSTLLDIVSRQPDSAFTQLILALIHTQQKHCASVLGKEADSRCHCRVISKPHSIGLDDETRAARVNPQASLSTVEQFTQDSRLAAKNTVLVSTSTQTSSEKNRWWMVEMLPSGERVYGVTSLHNHLYVLRADCIDVYTTSSDLTHIDRLPVSGLEGHEWNDLTSSMLHNCLYVADCARNLIRAVELGGSVSEWVVPDSPCGVSVTHDDDSLLVTCVDSRQLLELKLDGGDWLCRVELTPDIQRPWHAVKLTSGRYVVSHGSARGVAGQHRICEVDRQGNVLRSYGDQCGSDVGQLDWPCHLSLDKDGSVLVADSGNNRVELLSPAVGLKFMDHYVESLCHPRRLHLEHATRRLFISELTGRVVFVQLTAKQSRYSA